MSLSSADVLFVGLSNDVVAWYRCGMPAFYLGCDYLAIQGEPPHARYRTSLARFGSTIPDFENYKVIILQQPQGKRWLNRIIDLKRKGIRVLYEVDDYLHGVAGVKGHAGASQFSKKKLVEYESCMRAADGLICSTPYIAQRYRKFNRWAWVCRNSIETRRYTHELPERDTVNIGWAGGVGHAEGFKQWVPAINQIMEEHKEVRFVTVGEPLGQLLDDQKRVVALPQVTIENYPSILTNFDINLAPAAENSFFAGKSDLRFLEAGALGIPTVGHPFVYGDTIKDGYNGYLAETHDEVYLALKTLVFDDDARDVLGDVARRYVREHRTIEKGIEQWEAVFRGEPPVTA